jgi:hypothetical protein
MTTLHCSACGAAIPHASQFCAGCGLPLTAQAVPAVHVTGPRFSFGAVALIAIVGFVLLCWLASDIEHRNAAKQYAATSAELQPGGALSTPAGFQSRCGNATETKMTAAGIQLLYIASETVVTFPPQGSPKFALRVDFKNDLGHPDSFDKPEDAAYSMKQIGCIK